MKKIAILVAHLGNGGAERVSVNLANELSERNYEIHVVIFHNVKAEYTLNSKIKIHYLEQKKQKNGNFQKIMNLRKTLKKIQPDTVIELGFAIKYIIMGGLLHKYRYIFSMRNDPVMHWKNTKSLFKYLRNYYFMNAAYVVFQTQEAKNFYPKKIQDKGVIISNMIKEDLPDRYEGEREHRIVMFSRLNKQKNIPMALDAFKMVLKKYPDYVLQIYGRGEELDNLKQYAKELGIDSSVQFKGFSTNIHEEIKSAMLFVSSSDYEGISNSMIEALGVGVPCICTDCPAGGARLFIKDGENGYLVPVGNSKKMAQKICYAIEHPEKLEEISQRAVQIRKDLSTKNICDQWEELL